MKNTLCKCSICGRSCPEERLASHFLSCWKEEHAPGYSKNAPQQETIERKIDDDFLNFFQEVK